MKPTFWPGPSGSDPNVTDRFVTDDMIEAEGIDRTKLVNPTTPIDLSTERVVCPRHAEPFFRHWPEGYPTFALGAIGTLMEDRGFAEMVGGNIDKVNEILDQRPICERISGPNLMRLYLSSEIGRERRCDLCHEDSIGTPFRMGQPDGSIRTYHHVCFSCVVYRLSPAN